MKEIKEKYEMIAFAVMLDSRFNDFSTTIQEIEKFRKFLNIKEKSIKPFTIANDIYYKELKPLRNECLIKSFGTNDELNGVYDSSFSLAHKIARCIQFRNDNTSEQSSKYKSKDGLSKYIKRTLENLNVYLEGDNKISKNIIDEIADKYSKITINKTFKYK